MSPVERLRGSHLATWGLTAVTALLLVAVGMIVGWRLAGSSPADTEVGRVAFTVEPSLSGGAEVVIPVADWGLRADAFDAPFEISAELRSLDRPALARAAEGELPTLDAVEDDLRAGARAAVGRAFAWGAVTSLALLGVATLVWRPRPRLALLGIGVAAIALGVGASAWAALASFDARSFESPTYFAGGRELKRILEVAEDERVQSEYGSSFTSILRSISAVLADEPTPEAPGDDLYVASDLHANPLVIGPLARQVGAAPLLLAGDFGQRGGAAEARLLAPRVAALGERVVAVSGNHDSDGLMRVLAGEGVTVLTADGRLRPSGRVSGSPILDLDGVAVAGFPDPLEWRGEGDPPARPVIFDDLPDPRGALERAAAELVAWFDDLPRRPDVVMVHQNSLARLLAQTLHGRGFERNLVIVTGHDHRQHVDRYGDVIVVDAGSVGAGGAFDAGRAAIGFAELHLSVAAVLRSVDMIAIEPFSGQAQASRVVIDALCPDEDRCSFEPPELAGEPPAGAGN